ncbi:hypothetical protein Amet_1803 [Alkaliphilus metalliredigens QYMF]|uniref:DUF4367 domain-containing protein n=1 Tax=Alkaliphilus metalliredigens (strain QYMF) TaxID=293826 RepID=A6TP55_ALKMQ|nr:DUF4367 domain-containing protein [Alkaliphilus metalliredigens]ABR47973.1 hypothetical protein Amet_1803 [Alkaliphilus metalliredigens QYMF]
MTKKKDLDSIIKQVVQEETTLIEIPDMSDVWNNIENNINKGSYFTVFTFNNKVAGIVAAMLVLVFTYSNTDEGYAYYRRVLSFITNTVENKTVINIESRQSTNLNPDIDESWELITESLSVEEAIGRATFQIKIPTYTPAGYSIDEIILKQFAGETLTAGLLYMSQDQSLIKLVQEPILGEYAQTIQVDSERTKVSQFKENGIDYHMMEFSDGEVMVLWQMSEVKYTVTGVGKEEIKKLILSIE